MDSPNEPPDGNSMPFSSDAFLFQSVPPKRGAGADIGGSSVPSSQGCSQTPLLIGLAHNEAHQGQVPSSTSATTAAAHSSIQHQRPSWDPAMLLNPFAHRKSREQQSVARQPFAPCGQFSNGGIAQPSNPVPTEFQFSDLNDFSSSSAPSQQTSAFQDPAKTMSNGMLGSMIEHMNNVQDRSTVPVAKRRKIEGEGDEEAQKNGFHGASSGTLSLYVKQKQQEAQSMPGLKQAQPTLDLTGGMWLPSFMMLREG